MKLRLKIASIALVIIALATPQISAEKLVILHTNDTHSQLDPTKETDRGGILRRKALIDSVRSVNENVLLIDAGDIVQGTLYFNLYKGVPEYRFVNELGYDYCILGNHEFDNGEAILADLIAGTKAKYLATNYDLTNSPLKPYFKPYDIRTIGGKRIGFIAINIDPEGIISPFNSTGIKYLDAYKAANSMAWYLKHIEKVDMVIALTHIGYIKDDVNDIKLAETSEDIDMIIGGHSHTVINPDDPKGEKSRFLNTVGNTILVSQTGTQGVFVGEIDIDLDTKQADYKLISVDKRFDNRIDKDLSEYLASYRQKVDSVKHVYVGRSKVDIPRRSPAQVNLMTDFVKKCGDKMAKNVDFALLNIGGLRQGIMKGRLSEGELIETIPFSNYIQVVDIKGSDLQELFDICAVRRHVGVSDEARVTYDTIANRANVTINRAALDPERTYRVATIDYLVNGGDYLKPLKRAMVIATSPRMMYEDFINEFKNGQFKSKALNPSTESRTVIDSTK